MCVSEAGEMKSTLRLEEIKISRSLAGFRLWYRAIYQNNDNKFPPLPFDLSSHRFFTSLSLSPTHFLTLTPLFFWYSVDQAKKLFGEMKIYIEWAWWAIFHDVHTFTLRCARRESFYHLLRHRNFFCCGGWNGK
jgi:hypothetical protein